MARAIYEIAADVREAWVDKNGRPNVWFGAVPYLEAMETLRTVDDYYGLDTAQYILMYFIANAAHFRGERARELKAEIKALYKSKSK